MRPRRRGKCRPAKRAVLLTSGPLVRHRGPSAGPGAVQSGKRIRTRRKEDPMADQVNAPTLGFIGFGNMAQAMAKGLVEAGALPGTRIYATAAHFDKLQASTAALGAHACEDARGVVKASDFVVVAVKPHLVASVLDRCGCGLCRGCRT